MKKYLIMLCIAGSVHAAQVQEWNAALYAQGNRPQYSSVLFFLERNNVEIAGKRILDIGCGTGEITAFLAKKAQFVDGFDASSNMIEWAQEHHVPSHNNVSFMQCRVEDFSSDKKYDLATMFFCFHWFADKEKAFVQTAQALAENGELFGTFSTSDLPQQPGLVIVKKMMEEWNISTGFNESLGRSTISTPELKELLIKTGFDIITCEMQTNDVIFNDRADVEAFTRPVAMSRPFMQTMTFDQREKFLAQYLDRLIPVLEDTQTGQLHLKMNVMIVHARKK